jgi:peptide/nickel transport system substrate-binding protein
MPSLQQLKYLPQLLTLREKRLVRILLGIILISLILVGINFYFTRLESVPGVGGEYTEGLVGLPQFINPILAPASTTDMDMSRLVFSGLLRYDKNQRLIPDLAIRYEISDDGKTYTFFLRDNVLWHDEDSFTADDVIFTIQAIQDPEWRSPLLASFRGVEAEKIDDYTLKFVLEKPFAPFLSLLTFGIMPSHIWENIPPLQSHLTEFNIKPIGSGPFQFKSLTKDRRGFIKSYTLESFDKYYRQKPYLKRVTFKFFLNSEEAAEALETKKIDGLSYLPQDIKNRLASYKNIKIYTLHLPHFTALFFNKKANEFLDSKAIRTALAQSLDRQRIVSEVLANEGEVIDGPILAGQLGHHPEIQECWQSLGIKVELEIIPKNEIQKETIKPRAYQILLYGVISGFDPDPYSFWHSSQREVPGLNLAGFANRDADHLLEQARQTNDKEKRKELYITFQDIIAEELPVIFLYSPTHSYLVDKKIKGIDIKQISIPSDRFANIEEWYIKTKRRWKIEKP